MSLGLLFEHPEWWTASGLAVFGVAMATAVAQFRARRRLQTLLGRNAVHAPGSLRGDWLLVASLVFTAVALLGPRIGERTVLVSTRGADVVFLFDVSQSMDARDVAPSRMHRARAAASELLERLEPEDRAALAAFAGRGVLLTPLTPDTAALRDMLPALDTGLVRPPASDLAAGVDAALGAFEAASDRPRVVVVLSDGEVVDRESTAAGMAAARANARVLAAALGTEVGGTIPAAGGELRDSTGQVVVTRRRTAPLANLAEASAGRLFEADEWGAFDLAEAAREIGREARGRPGELIPRRVAAPMVLPFAAAAFALLLLEWLPAGGLRALRRRALPLLAPRRVVASSGVALLVLLPRPGPAQSEAPASDPATRLEASARHRELEAHELLQLGIARAQQDRWPEAENSFLAAAMLAGSGETAAIAYHDLGVAALRRGELEPARDLFFESLAVRPDHPETRFNLEWTIAALRVQPQPETPPLAPPPEAGNDSDANADEDEDSDAQPEPDVPELAEQSEAKRDAEPAPRPTPPELSEEQREQWIERIRDDPGKALSSAARPAADEPMPARRRGTSAW